MANDSQASGKHTAVVFFHGMGSQRRYESVSQLVDSLDAYATNEGKGKLEQPKDKAVQFETNALANERISYLEAEVPGEKVKAKFYEVYWAPLAADAPSAADVTRWLFKQTLVPFWVLSTPWRDRQRLHRSVLFRMYAQASDADKNDGDVTEVCRLYQAFGDSPERILKKNPEGQTNVWTKLHNFFTRLNAPGNFREFLNFVDEQVTDLPKKERLIVLSRRWRDAYIRAQIFNLLAAYTTILYFALVLVLIAVAFYSLADWIPPLKMILSAGGLDNPLDGSVGELLGSNEESIKAFLNTNFARCLSVILAVASLVVTRFLRDFMGDVLQWVTYEETNVKNQKRRTILQLGFNTLAHVLSDERCERLLVVGHSLGTAIAMDSLLELRRHNLAAPEDKRLPLERFQGFITSGSPIDRIHYFFESYRVGKGRRYGTVVEHARGDLGTQPFTTQVENKPFWINVHDAGDFISSGLHTPNAVLADKVLSVSNIRRVNHLFPVLGQTHNSYLKTRTFIGIVYQAVFQKRGPTLTDVEVPQLPDWVIRINFFNISLWLWPLFAFVLSLLLEHFLGLPRLPAWILYISLVSASLLLVGFVAHFFVRSVDDVYKPKKPAPDYSQVRKPSV